MKKFVALLICIILAGCSLPSTPPASVQPSAESVGKSAYSYTRNMKNPDLSSVDNLMMMQNGYSTTKTLRYTLSKQDMEMIDSEKSRCPSFDFVLATTNTSLGQYPSQDLKLGKTFDWTIPYSGEGLGLQFSDQQLATLRNKGWIIFEPNAELLKKITGGINYDSATLEPMIPEWAYYYQLLAGSDNPQDRYPYNTIYVSSDLLLHSYHKLFSNTLKEYEMTRARDLLSSSIDQALERFSTLSKHSDANLKATYDYLTAYWTLARILLPRADEIEQVKNQALQDHDYSTESTILDENYGDLRDSYIATRLHERADQLTQRYSTPYNHALQESLSAILEGKDMKQLDFLAEAFSPQSDPDFVITQDYTQFVPRSHYTDNSYLKTYFMAMKWLMRHKFYTRDDKMAQAALILAHEIPQSAQDSLNQLQDFVHRMIGSDDDTTLQDLQKFLSDKKIRTDSDILSQYQPSWSSELATLRPQRLISTSYVTPSEGSSSEAEAKRMTAGFVLFGEKFTSDGWVMDELSAGDAEKESATKPPVVSVYQIWDVIMGGQRASFAQQRLHNNKKQFQLKQQQLDAYPALRDQLQQQLGSVIEDDTIYQRRIELSRLARRIPQNAPTYMSEPSFVDKIYNTILGSYTELKHDTLLYVKQVYAERGAGGNGCSVVIDREPLPVPKGYIEPQLDLIDGLREAVDSTSKFFGSTNKENFDLYREYLEFVKRLALAQSHNETISDEDFERLRTSSSLLEQVMSPSPSYTTQGERGMRSALIADIFTSGAFGPYYIATGRPLLMIVLIDDTNGKRAVIGPVFSTYEFYGRPIASEAGRYTDTERRNAYDSLSSSQKTNIMTLPLQDILIR